MLATALLSGCVASAPEPVPTRDSRRGALAAGQSVTAVLSAELDPEAVDSDIVILDPDHAEADGVTALRRRGATTLAYVNIGEAESYRWFYDRVDPAWLLGENPNWADHFYADAREPGWRAVVGEAASRAVSLGVDGLFLDMADVALPGLHPETEPGMVALIEELRASFPAHLLVMNRGLFLVERVDVDGLLIEGVFTRYDLEQGHYVRTPADRQQALSEALLAFRARTGGAALIIDYADRDSEAEYARASAAALGLPIFVGRVELGAPTGRGQ